MKTTIKSLIVGPPGSGKTFFAGSYPKSYWISTEPDGYTSVMMNPKLSSNTVKQEYFIPSPLEGVDKVFLRTAEAFKEAHQLYRDGKIETLILDNMTYFAENRWMYINQFQKQTTRSGEDDTRGMYGVLGRWLYEFTLLNICSFPGNVVVTCHIKQEHEEALKKKVGKDDIVADILGGFRNQAPGMFSLVLFLDKIRKGDNQYDYLARADLGAGKLAKNRYNLPEIIKNVSYTTVTDAIKLAQKGA